MPSGTPPHQSSPHLRRSTNGEPAAERQDSPSQQDGHDGARATPMPPLEGAGRQMPKPPQRQPPTPPTPPTSPPAKETIPPLPRAQSRQQPAQAASPPPPPPPIARPASPRESHRPAPQSGARIPAGLPVGSPIAPTAKMPPLPGQPRRRARSNPRVFAAFAYALPIVSAVVMLARQRRHPFIRIHAIQALVFYLLVALGQSVLFVLVVKTGNISHSLPLAIGLFFVFLALFAGLGLWAMVVWLRLIRDALRGRRSRFAVISRAADWIERLASRRERASTPSALGKNSPAR